jgi:hypothetical protein
MNSTRLVDAYNDYICFGEVAFHHFKMEKRATIKFSIKLNKTAAETFEMFNGAYSEESLSRQVSQWHERFKGQQLEDTSRTEESPEELSTFGC